MTLRANPILQAVLAVLAFCAPVLAHSSASSGVYKMSDASKVTGSSAALVRTSTGVAGNFLTTATPGDAYTIWWVVFNTPENCTGGVCDLDDVMPPPGNLQAGVSVLYATGHVADANGKAEFGAALEAGDMNPVLFGPGLTDVTNAEIHMVLRSHGPALADPYLLLEQISSFDGGCPPNECMDEQFAVFEPYGDETAIAMAEIQDLLRRIAQRLSLQP